MKWTLCYFFPLLALVSATRLNSKDSHRSLVSTQYKCVTQAATAFAAAGAELKLGVGGTADLAGLFTFNEKIKCTFTFAGAFGALDMTASLRNNAVTSAGAYDATTTSNVDGVRNIKQTTSANAATATYEIAGAKHLSFLYLKLNTALTSQTIKVDCECFFSGSSATFEVPPDPQTTTDCFSKDGLVTVQDKGLVSMSNLSAGDYVMNSFGTYEPLLGFTHKNDQEIREFFQFYTEGSKKPLEVTGKHLVYKYGSNAPVAAESLKVGDSLTGTRGALTITKIDRVIKDGIYAPLTSSGHVVVDGVKVSNYVQLQENSEYATLRNGWTLGISQHMGIHLFATPFRILCKVGLGNICLSSNEDGMLFWVEKGIEFAEFAKEQHTVVQLFMLCFLLAFMLPLYLSEMLITSHALSAGALTVVAVYLQKNGIQLQSRKVKTV